ncbi:MAG: hypothetical protein KAU38_12195, partial [Desulfobacterales bacterium]|nr:hypothetical protein [Desulfobacterales bacterium]
MVPTYGAGRAGGPGGLTGSTGFLAIDKSIYLSTIIKYDLTIWKRLWRNRYGIYLGGYDMRRFHSYGPVNSKVH